MLPLSAVAPLPTPVAEAVAEARREGLAMEVWEGTSSVARLLSASSVHMPDLAAPVVRGCCDLARIVLASR